MNSLLDIQLNNKVAICYTCTTKIVREIVLWQLTNRWFDNDNLYYFIITDDKSVFSDCQRKNLIVNDILEYNTHVLEKPQSPWPFSFSLFRFHLQQVKPYGITNLGMFCADSIFREEFYNNPQQLENVINNITQEPNTLYNHVNVFSINAKTGLQTIGHTHPPYRDIFLNTLSYLKQEYNFTPTSEIIKVPDAAVRFFNFDDENKIDFLFEVWEKVIKHFYNNPFTDLFGNLTSGTIINDEYILGPIYNMLGLEPSLVKQNESYPFVSHHKIMKLTQIKEATIDLNKSLQENFETYIKDEDYFFN